jgi:hypothetical protein
MFSICPVTPFRLSPSLTRHVHDVKAMEASKKLSNLLSVRSDARGYSPSIVFVAMLCGLVQLAATEIHGAVCADHHQNRIVLVLGCLKLLRAKWFLAETAHAHLRSAAAQVVTSSSEYSLSERKPTHPQGDTRPHERIEESAMYLPIDDESMNDQFCSGLLSEFIDPTCGVSFL